MDLSKHWAATLDDYVIDLAWSSDGSLLAAASAAGPISVFAASDGARRHELPGHENGTNAIAFASVREAPLLASGGQDGAVKFWDAAAGQHAATAELGTAWVEHLAWRPAFARGYGEASPPSGSTPPPSNLEPSTSSLPPAPSIPSTLPLPPYAFVLAVAAGRTLALLRPDGSVLHTFAPAPKTITALAWRPSLPPSPEATARQAPLSPSTLPLAPYPSILAAAYFGGVCLWNSETFAAWKELPYNNGIHALVWSPDGKWLVSGNQDPSVHLWIPAADDELHMSGYESKVKHLAFDRTSRWLATGGGRDACIWDCSGAGPEGREPAMFPHEAPVCALAFQHTHGILATASQDGVVMLWSPERPQPLRATVKMPAPATKLLWSPNDSQLAIGSEKGAVYVLKAD